MQLIGMLNSPYVRRVAISLQFLGVRFEHQPVSVFSQFDEFRAINPVVKAPSLVCDDGQVLMDSTLILEYAEAIAAPSKSLMPTDRLGRTRALRILGLALAACEKTVQVVYERGLRPADKIHAPWLARVTVQLLAAYESLESEVSRHPLQATSAIDQAGITTAVAWRFTQATLPDVVEAPRYPSLRDFSVRAEELGEFRAAAHGTEPYKER